MPTLKDGDLVLNESRAMMTSLAGKAGGDVGKKLYPADLEIR